MKRIALAVLMAVAAAIVLPASAQDTPQSVAPAQPTAPEQAKAPPARYRFERVADSFLRFDNVTGEVTYCAPQTAGWACEAVPEDSAVLKKEREIGRLQQEIAGLKQQLAALQPPPPPRPPAAIPPEGTTTPQASGGAVTIVMPTQADIDRAKDRARAIITDAWHRVVDMIVNIQKEAMRWG